MKSVFADFAVRHIGGGEHDGLVIAVTRRVLIRCRYSCISDAL